MQWNSNFNFKTNNIRKKLLKCRLIIIKSFMLSEPKRQHSVKNILSKKKKNYQKFHYCYNLFNISFNFIKLFLFFFIS